MAYRRSLSTAQECWLCLVERAHIKLRRVDPWAVEFICKYQMAYISLLFTVLLSFGRGPTSLIK